MSFIAHGQATYDNNGVVGGGSKSITVPSGYNRLLVVHLGSFGSNRSASFNGTPMTEVITKTASGWVGRTTLFVLPLGTGCEITANVTTSSGGGGGGPARIFWAGTFQHVNQDTPIPDKGSAAIPGGTSTSNIGGLTNVAGMDILFDGILVGDNGSGAPSPSPTGGGNTVLYNQHFSGNTQRSAARFKAGPGGNSTLGWTVDRGWSKPHVAMVISGITQETYPLDTENPVAICMDVTVALDQDGNGTVNANEVNDGSSDNCSIASITLSQEQFDCTHVGDNSVTLTVTDGAGLTASCSATVTVEDNIAPVVVCQDVTVQLDPITGTTPASPFATGALVSRSDNCALVGGVSSNGPNPITCGQVGSYNQTTFVSDVNGNVTPCTVEITVEDNTAPSAVCQNFTVQLDGSGNASISGSDIDGGSNDACGIGSLSASPNTFGCNDVGINTSTLTVMDNSGNTSTCSASVTVQDNAAPTAVCQDFTLNLDNPGITTLNPADIDGGSSTACGTYSLSVSPTGFNCDDLGGGPYTVTLTVTDDSNSQTDNCTANITIADPDSYCCAPPAAVCQNTTVQLDANGDGSITASDIDGGSIAECGLQSLIATPTTFNCSDVGTNTVTLTITDINSDSDNCTATVTVQDNVAPNAVCQNTTVQLDANGDGSIVDADIDGGSTDACGVASISASVTDFDCADVGSNSVTLTVSDVNGNTNTCTATVTVEDNIAPDVVCQNFTAQLDANGNVTISGNDIDGGSTDACGIASRIANPASFGCENVGANTATLTVTDNNGNTNTCTATVTVEDNVSPNAVCQNTTVQLDEDGNGSIAAADIDGGSNDACGVVSIAASTTEFTCQEAGDNTVTLTVIDVNGNSSACTATVTVEDNVAPEIILCQGNSIDFNGEEEILASTGITFDADDACGIASITYDPEYVSCEQLGETVPVTVTVTDVSGNSNSCVANVLITGLPCGWMDFGDDGIGCVESNDASYDVPTETFTLESEGCYSTNWSADNAAYVKYELCGDGEIIAHVASMSPIGGGWAGISARESEAPGSKKVTLATNLGNFLRREIRTTTNGYAIPQQFFRPGATWLKITRMGNQFIGSASADGVNWQIVLATNVPMTSCIQFGLFVTNTNAGTLTATFDNIEVTENTISAFAIPNTDQQGADAQSFASQDFRIFPNPATDEIQLDLSDYYGMDVQIEILNQLGQSVLQRKVAEVGSTTERFNLSGWSDGTYFVRVVKDNEQQIKKFVIVK